MNKKSVFTVIFTIIILLIGITVANAQMFGPYLWRLKSGAIIPVLSTWTLGDTTDRLSEGWFTDVDSTTGTIATIDGTTLTYTNINGTTGILGALTMDNTDPSIIFDTNTAGDSDFWMGNQSDGAGDDNDYFYIGYGTTPGSNPYFRMNAVGDVLVGDAITYAPVNLGQVAFRVYKYSENTSFSTSAAIAPYYVVKVTSDTTNDFTCANYLLTIDPTSTHNLDRADGFYAYVRHYGVSGTINRARGASGLVYVNGDGTITDAMGLWSGVYNDDAQGTIGSAYGCYITTGRNTGTVTNRYGLYLETQTAGNTCYSIYSAGGQSYHAGNFGIGVVPSNKLDVNGVTTLGDGGSTNYASFSATGALTYNGTARPTRYIVPEIGAVVPYADGGNNDATVTADADPTNNRTFVRVTSSNVAVQDYDLVWQFRIPGDFSAFVAANAVQIDTRSSDNANTAAVLYVYDGTNTVDSGINGADINPSSDDTWESKTDQPANSYSAGDWCRIQVKLSAGNGDTIDIARVCISYLAAN